MKYNKLGLLFTTIFSCFGIIISNLDSKIETVVDKRIHSINDGIKALEENDFEVINFEDNANGFKTKSRKKIKRSLLSSICYLSFNEEETEVEYDVDYECDSHIMLIDSTILETDQVYSSEVIPIFNSDAEFDGTVIIDGEEQNIYDIYDEYFGYEENDSEDCAVLAVTIGVGLVVAAVVALVGYIISATTNKDPVYIGNIDSKLDIDFTEAMVYISFVTLGLSVQMTKISAKIIAQMGVKDNARYRLVMPITNQNITTFPGCKVGDMLVSLYTINITQASKELKKGTSVYTFFATNAKAVVKAAFPLLSTIRHNASKSEYFNHYHPAILGIEHKVSGHSVHAFYGIN